jgi:urease accessory protein
MGADSARITAADFLIPPELAAWRLSPDGSGRIGGVRLSLVADNGAAQLGDCYQQVPLRVLPPFRFGADQPALLYLLNPTAGLLDGDAQLVRLCAGPDTRAVVVGQSATRIHPAVHGLCTQQYAVSVAAGAVLVVLPGPAIPFQGCRYYQRVSVELEEGAGLVWGDLWTAGRCARPEDAEQFRFQTLVQEFAVRRQGRLIYRDRFCWQGPWGQVERVWHFGGALACGSLFATGPVFLDNIPTAAPIRRALFATAFGDTAVRWYGPAKTINAQVVQTALLVAARLAGSPGQPWLLAGHDLGPNHWFSPMSS